MTVTLAHRQPKREVVIGDIYFARHQPVVRHRGVQTSQTVSAHDRSFSNDRSLLEEGHRFVELTACSQKYSQPLESERFSRSSTKLAVQLDRLA